MYISNYQKYKLPEIHDFGISRRKAPEFYEQFFLALIDPIVSKQVFDWPNHPHDLCRISRISVCSHTTDLVPGYGPLSIPHSAGTPDFSCQQ